jgi:Right handed beta helix region
MSRKHRRQQIVTGAGVGIGATLLMGGTAEGATFTVDSKADPSETSHTTLRDAITSAELPANSGSTITFASGLSGTIHLGSSLPEVAEPTTIQGPGAGVITISGEDAYAIFQLDSTEDGFPVSISGLTLADGNTPDSGGAINTYNADLTLTGMVISDNVANNSGGAIDAYSGLGALTVRDSTLTGNSTVAGVGGAIYAAGQPIAIVNSTFAGNSSPYRGGAVGIDEPSGLSTIENSTFFKNRMTAYSATSSGGALYVYGADNGVTISGSTIVENAATYGGGIFNHDAFDAPPIILHDTIVSGNTAMAAGPNLAGPFESAFSLLENTTGASVTEAVPGSDILGQDPQLGDLASNGGPTQTIKPAATSPVVDRGSAFGLGIDQRGLLRPFDAPTIANSGGDASDIGAVELQASEVPPAPPAAAAPVQAKKKKCKKKKHKRSAQSAKKKKCKKKKKRR